MDVPQMSTPQRHQDIPSAGFRDMPSHTHGSPHQHQLAFCFLLFWALFRCEPNRQAGWMEAASLIRQAGRLPAQRRVWQAGAAAAQICMTQTAGPPSRPRALSLGRKGQPERGEPAGAGPDNSSSAAVCLLGPRLMSEQSTGHGYVSTEACRHQS